MKTNNNLSLLLVKNIPLVLFSVIYYAIIIFLASYLNVWEDEVYSLNTSSGSLGYAFHQSINFELQPPVYFMLLTLWRTISDSIFWARLFSVIIIIISQILLFHFAKNVSNKKIATLISILFLLNPATIYVLLEILSFPLVILLSILIISSFYGIYYNNQITVVRRILFVLLAIIGVFTQYYIGFLLFANSLVLVYEKKWQILRSYILDMIIPLSLLLIFIPQILSCSDTQSASFPVYERSFSDFLFEIKALISQITFGYFLPVDFIHSKIWQWTLKGILIIILFFSINHIELRRGLRELLFLIIISFIIIGFFIIILYHFGIYAVEYKYTLILFVTLSISMIFIFKLLKPGLLYFWLVIFSFIYITSDYQKYHELYKVKDFRSLGKYIENNEGKDEPIYVYRNISAENLSLYYNGKNKIYPVPKSFSYSEAFGPNQWKINFKDINELNDRLMNYSRFYIIIDNSPLRGVGESKEVLLDFLVNNFSLIEKKPFNGKIVLYKYSNNTE